MTLHLLLRFIIMVAILIPVIGCSSKITVKVDSIVDKTVSSTGKHYVLTRGMSHTETNHLYFREFSQYFDHILQKNGFIKVANLDQADLEIQFKYGISDGQMGIYSYSTPIYEHIGGETITVTETSKGESGETIVTKRIIRVPVRFRQTGASVTTGSYTRYKFIASLKAKTKPQTTGNAKQAILWQIDMSNVSESDDTRAIMPYLAAASHGFFGQNTGQQVKRVIDQQDPLVIELKNLVRTPSQ